MSFYPHKLLICMAFIVVWKPVYPSFKIICFWGPLRIEKSTTLSLYCTFWVLLKITSDCSDPVSECWEDGARSRLFLSIIDEIYWFLLLVEFYLWILKLFEVSKPSHSFWRVNLPNDYLNPWIMGDPDMPERSELCSNLQGCDESLLFSSYRNLGSRTLVMRSLSSSWIWSTFSMSSWLPVSSSVA